MNVIDIDWCNCKNKLSYELRYRYIWLKKEIEKEIMKLEYLVRGITLISN